ncbi:alpha-2-macroglobulin family protein [Thalassotalea litorea]|uniref:alpha-2-macroglobulin family protein n=1 Tax=Thalassotalea litorea TaxID=2020715 RepID=UPI0037357614
MANQVDYMGHYMHKDKPAIIVQFAQPVAAIDKPFKIRISKIQADKTLQDLSAYNQLNKNNLALINTKVEVGSRYRVEAFDIGGVTPFASKDVTIAQINSDVTILGRGPVIPADGPRTIPLSVVNLDSVSVEILRITEPGKFIQKSFYNRQVSSYQVQRLSKYLKSITTLDFQLPKLPVNKSQSLDLKLPSDLSHGWYLLAVKGGGQFDYDSTKFIQVLLTDIGIQAKVFEQQLAIHATYFSGSAFAQDATVYVLQPNVGKTKLGTLKNGFGQFPYKTQGNEVLLIETPQHTGWLPLKEMPLDLSDFDVTGNAYQPVQAYVYSNRDLFKSGEALPLNILLRDQDGALVKQSRLYVEFVQPDGKIIANRWLQGNDAGFFQTQYLIPMSAALGKWHARVKTHSGAKKAIAQLTFFVSEFVPERMDLQVETSTITLQPKPRVTLDVEGRYLFGAPTAGNQLKITPYYQSLHHLQGPYQAYFVGTPYTIYPSRDLPKFDAIQLDEEGKASFDYPLMSLDKLSSPVTVNLTSELFEQGGATITRKQKISYWSGEPLTAIKAPAKVQAYQQVSFELGVLSADGQALLAGNIEYRLERNRGGYYWTYEDQAGWSMHRDNEWRPVYMDQVQTEQGQSKPLKLRVEYGNYRLVTWQAGGTKTTYAFNAQWQGAGKQKPAKPDQLGLRLDKTTYHAGDTAAVQIQSPVAGKLLLTLESDQVEWTYQQQLAEGEATILVPIDSDSNRHDLYLSATLVSNQAAVPRRLFAIAPIALDRSERELQVHISHQDILLPLQTASLQIDAKDSAGKPAWVTVSMVDKGIVNLSGYNPQNPFDYFFSHQRYGGDVVDLYARFYQQRPDSFLQHRYGGDAQVAFNQRPDQLVESKTITLMSEAIRLDDSGQGKVSLQIPDYNGEAQVIATVFTQDSFGQAIKDVTIRAPIVAELAIPRFLTPGDESQVMLEVFHQADSDSANDAMEIDMTIELPEALQLLSKAQLNVALKYGERAHLPVRFKVAKGIDSAAVTIHIKSQASSFSRRWTVPVRDGMPLITKKSTRTLSAGERLTLNNAFWQDIELSQNHPGGLALSANALLDPMPYAEHLFAYPYGCAEQTTSKALPWLIDNPDLNAQKQSKLDNNTPRHLLETAIARLSGMQKSTGGFALWNKHGKEDPWVSVYVTDFLLKANENYPQIVPKSMMNRAIKRIKQRAYQNQPPAQYYGYWLLAQTNQIDYGKLQQLQGGFAPGPLASAYLGAALMLKGDIENGQKLLLDSKKTPRIAQHSWNYDYGSYLRDYARIAIVISELGGYVKLSDEVIRMRNDLIQKVKRDLNRRQYLSTQEQIALVELGTLLGQDRQQPYQYQYAHAVQQDVDVQQQTDEQAPQDNNDAYEHDFDDKVQMGITRLPLIDGGVIENSNDFPLYVEILARGPASDKAAYQSTMDYENLGKQLLRENGDVYKGEPLNVGEKLIVVIDAHSNEKVDQALLVDFLPTGFVIENPMFTNANEVLRAAGLKAEALLHEEFRNDRYVAAVAMDGRKNYNFAYVIRAETPSIAKATPALIEDMYEPERLLFIEPVFDEFVIKQP